MVFRILILCIIVMLLTTLCGCQTIGGVGMAFKGMGEDLQWLGQQRVHVYHEGQQDVLYYSEVGGEKAYFKKIGEQYVQVDSW